MKVLSLFDGVSCARLAIEKAGIPIQAYYASEIDKYAIKVTQANRPDTIHLGSVTELYQTPNLHNVDLLIGGSPCQDLSIAKKDRKGLDGDRSGLFWEYVRILRETKPKYFILENVASMPQKDKDIISQTLGVQPVMINASLVSAQNRKRLFWVGKLFGDKYHGIHIPQPEDKNILLKDVLESGFTDKYKSYCIDANYFKGTNLKQYQEKCRRQIVMCEEPIQVFKEGRTELGKKSRKEIRLKTGRDSTMRSKDHKAYFGRPGTKANCLVTSPNMENTIAENFIIRKLTPIECERLQCMPDNWTNPTGDISNSQRYKMCGNAFNVDVVAHIVKVLNRNFIGIERDEEYCKIATARINNLTSK